MYCRKCGKEIDDNVLVCPHCGARTDDSGKGSGEGVASLLRVDVLVVVAVIILIPLLLYLFTGKKNSSGGKDSQSEPQVAAAEQDDQAAAEQGDQAAAEQSDQAAADQADAENQAEQEAANEEPAPQAPDYAMAYGGHHYYIYDDGKISFSQAADNCEGQGGHLAKIDDEEENEALYNYMIDQGYEEAFFGLVYEDGKWVNYDGSEAVYFDWGTNSAGVEEPNNSGGSEFNVQMDVNMHSGHWNDAEFGAEVFTPDGAKYKDRYAYICEWDY